MYDNWRIGTTVWLERTDEGDKVHVVRFVMEQQPTESDYCRYCHQRSLVSLGTLVQHGILDNKVYAVMDCQSCQSVTVFIYHVSLHMADEESEG